MTSKYGYLLGFLACLAAPVAASAATTGYEIASPSTSLGGKGGSVGSPGTLATLPPSKTVPPISPSSSVQVAPSASTSGGTPGNTSTNPGTAATPVRNYERTSAISHAFGNANFQAGYSAGLSFFGGRTAQLVPVSDCTHNIAPPSSANNYDTGEAQIDACLDSLVTAAEILHNDCAASGRDIEYCMTDPAFRAAHPQQVSKIRLEMEQRILSTQGWLRAHGKVLEIPVSFVDIQLGARSSLSQSPAATVHYFVRNQDVYHASGPGAQSYSKTTDALLFSAEKVYLIGGVIPMTLRAEAVGHTGITFQATAGTATTSVGVTPHARVDGTGSVKLDLGLYAGGVQLDLEFLDIQVPSAASLARTQLTGADRLSWSINSSVTLHSLAGQVSLFGKPVWRDFYDYRGLLAWQGFGTVIPIYSSNGDAYTKAPIL